MTATLRPAEPTARDVYISPSERMPDTLTAQENMDNVQGQIERARDPGVRAVLQAELERQQRDGPPQAYGGPAPADRGVPAAPAAAAPHGAADSDLNYLPTYAQIAAGLHTPAATGAAPSTAPAKTGTDLDYLPSIESLQGPAEPSLWDQVKKTASNAADAYNSPDGGVMAGLGAVVDGAMGGNSAPSQGGVVGHVADTVRGLFQGTAQIANSAVGLASLATGGWIGQVAKDAGWQGDVGQQMISGYQSAGLQEGKEAVASAKGFWNTLAATVTHPATIMDQFAQMVPSLPVAGAVGGAMATGAFARAVMPYALDAAKAAGLTGDAASQFAAKYMAGVIPEAAQLAGETAGTAAQTAGAAGFFGGQTAGSVENSGEAAGLPWSTTAPAGLAAGAATAATIFGGAAVSKLLGTGDVYTGAAATAARSRLMNAGIEATKQGVENAAMGVESQAGDNVATGKPIDDNLGNAAAGGGLLGAALGAGHGVLHTAKPAGVTPRLDPVAVLNAGDQALSQVTGAFHDAAQTYLQQPNSEQVLGSIAQAPTVDAAIAAANAAAEAPSSLLGATVTARRAQGAALADVMDRQSELVAQQNAAATEADRQSAAAQAQTHLEQNTSPTPSASAGFADLTPMDERTAQGRLTALRDQTSNAGGNTLGMDVVPHPSQDGKFAISSGKETPSLDLPAKADVAPAEAQNRIESAALVGSDAARKADDAPRQSMLSQIFQNIKDRNGVASPQEAQLLQQENLGRPFNRVDLSLGPDPKLTTDQKLQQATGVIPGSDGNPPRSRTSFAPDTSAADTAAEQRARSDSRMAELAKNKQAGLDAQTAAAQEAAAAAAPPAAADVIAAARVAPADQTQSQRTTLAQAKDRYSPNDFRILEGAGKAPFTLDGADRARLGDLKKSEQREPVAAASSDGKPVSADDSDALRNAPRTDLSTLPEQSAAKPGEMSKQSHKFLKTLASVFGKKLNVFEGGDKMADGFYDPAKPNEINLNRNSQQSHLVVFGHELLHSLAKDNPAAYDAINRVMKIRAGSEEKFNSTKGISGNREEALADIHGNMFADHSFWHDVFKQVVQKSNDPAAATKLGTTLMKTVGRFVKALGGIKGFDTHEMVENMGDVRASMVKALADYAGDRHGAAIDLANEGRATEAPKGTGEQASPVVTTGPPETKAAPTRAEKTAAAAAAARADMGLKFSQQREREDGISVNKTPVGFEAKDKDGNRVGYLKSNLTPEQSKSLNEPASADIVKVDDAVKGKGVGAELYRQWHDAHDGRVAPSGKTSPDAWKVWKRDYPEKVDEFVSQEAARIRGGARVDQVLSGVTDPEIRSRVAEEAHGVLASSKRDQEDTPAFRKWFGKSKAVDKLQRPQVVYHGTGADFSKFDQDKVRDEGGHFFSSNPEVSDAFAHNHFKTEGGNVMPAYLRMENPYERTEDQWNDAQGMSPEQAREAGHDGFKIKGNDGHNTYVAYEPSSIKSAIGNRGTFDRNSDDVTQSKKREGPDPISLEGVHYSKAERTNLSPAYSGTSNPGAEAERGAGKAINFYVDHGQGVKPESGVGAYAHKAQLNNLYDAGTDAEYHKADSTDDNDFEKRVLRAGYSGYYAPDFRKDQGAVRMIDGKSIPVEPIGQGSQPPSGAPVQRATRSDTGFRADIETLKKQPGLPMGAVAAGDWGDRVKRANPSLYDAMAKVGLWSQLDGEKGSIYKNDLVKQYKALSLRAADVDGNAATLDDFSKANIHSLLDKKDWAILTAENPRGEQASAEDNAAAMTKLKSDLDAIGADYKPARGKYGNLENSLAVARIKEADAVRLGKAHDQDSVLTNKGLIHQDGHITPATGMESFKHEPEDYYSTIDGHHFAVKLDHDNPVYPGDLKSSEKRDGDDTDKGAFTAADRTISTRKPTAPGATEKMNERKLNVGMGVVYNDPKLLAKHANIIRNDPLSGPDKSGTDKQVVGRFIDTLKSNLLALYDKANPDDRARSEGWYDGANKIANQLSEQAGVDPHVGAAVLAAFSPQTDWNRNVSQAARLISIWKEHQDTQTTPEMHDWFGEQSAKLQKLAISKGGGPEKAAAMDTIGEFMRGKSLADVDQSVLQGWWIRAYDEAHNDRSYHLVAPEGVSAGVMYNADGVTPAKMGWGNSKSAAKAIEVLKNSSMETVSNQMGDAHKVRSFYNNIAEPNNQDGHVTIDTHAVAAARMDALSGDSPEVKQAWGGQGSSTVRGQGGLYGEYAEAYRQAAEERGILPRQMQSVTWEAVRGLFPDTFKTEMSEQFKASKEATGEGTNAIKEIWKRYEAGDIGLDDARKEVIDATPNGQARPDWAGSDRAGVEDRGSSEHAGDEAGDAVRGGPGADGQPGQPHVAASEKRIVDDSDRDYTAGQRAAFERVGRTVDVPSLKERAQALRKNIGAKLQQGLVDQFAPIKDISTNGYLLSRLSKGAPGALDAFLNHGKLSLKDGVYDADRSGGALDRVFRPLKNETGDFLWWVAANRAEGLAKEDRERLFSAADIAELKGLDKNTTDFDYTTRDGQVTRDRSVIYRDALKEFNDFHANALDMAEQSGMIDPESRKIWEKEFYVPFNRVSEKEGSFIGAGIKDGLVRQQAIKMLKGGTDKLNSDLLQNTLLNWNHLIDSASKNRAAKATLEAAANMGIATEAPKATIASMGKAGGQAVWFLDHGMQRHFIVDPARSDVLAAINSLSDTGFHNPVMDAMSTMKHWLTVGATSSPVFKLKHLIRGSMVAMGISDSSYNPIKNAIDGFRTSDPHSQTYVSNLAGGGLFHFGSMLEGNTSENVRKLIARGIATDGSVLDSDHKVKAVLGKMQNAFDAYNEFSNRGEEMPRTALYKQLTDRGVSHADAILQARDMLDYSLQGAWPMIRAITQTVPFMNARAQGLYKLGRAGVENPARMAAVLGVMGAASAGLMSHYSDDEDWKRRDDSDRDNFWWFKFGGTAYRIPKPFEMGAVATLAERGLELFTNDEMTKDRFLKVVGSTVSNQLNLNPVPQALKPILDLYSNTDHFSGRPIETPGMEKELPAYRYTANTSMAARAASTALNAPLSALGLDKDGITAPSPVQIDHLVQGYFGWLGTMAVSAGDMVARPMTDEPARPTADYVKLASGGLASDPTGQGARYTTQLYDQAQALEQAYNTRNELIKSGKLDDAREFNQDHQDELSRYSASEAAKQVQTRINESIKMIERSTTMDPDDKRDRINALREQASRAAATATPR